MLVLALTSCSKHEAPLKTAVDELTRLGSCTETGLTYTQYSTRVLTAKGNIDVVLRESKDDGAKSRIETALNYYVEAQNAWTRTPDENYADSEEARSYWTKGKEATEAAAQFAFADRAKRDKIREEEMALFNATLRASEEADRQAAEEQRARKAQQAEMEARQQAADRKKLADEVERERVRRFAPAGIVYSIKRITFTTPDGLMSVPPGTELKTTNTASNGMLRVCQGDLETDVPTSAVSNDRDLVAAVLAALPVKRAIQNAARRPPANKILVANPTTR